MRLTYELERYGCGTLAPMAWARRFRADAAALLFRQMVHDMIAAQGLLDRQAGHDAMRKAESFEIAAPRLGYRKDWQVRLGDACVKLTAIHQ